MTESSWNPWKMTTIGIGLAAAVALITGVVVANWTAVEPVAKTDAPVAAPRAASTHTPNAAPRVVAAPAPVVVASAPAPAPVAAPAPAPAPVTVAAPLPAVPSQAAIDACNQQAAAQASGTSKTVEVVKDGAIGAVVGAVVGAAGGAIVDGGSGAGKGAAIGGLIGAGGGALYGVNANHKNDERYKSAYAGCMRSRGYAS
jgi:hypothetical protein